MSSVRVYLSGEGPNELGSYTGLPSDWVESEQGVLHALLRKVQADGWSVSGAMCWSRIRKYSATGPTPNEERNVLGLVLEAIRSEAQVVAFVRDSDADSERQRVIQSALDKAKSKFPKIGIIGGVAHPVLEAWLLALQQVPKSEQLKKVAAQKQLASTGVADKDTRSMVRLVDESHLDQVPRDAVTLHAWLNAARAILPILVAEARR